MAREVVDIKKSITDRFMANETVRANYGLEEGDEFDREFSKLSIENTLFDVFSLGVNDLEQLMDIHMNEVLEALYNDKAHRHLWYQQKTLAYMDGFLLVPEKDYYDTSGMTDVEIADAQIVKYCAVPPLRDDDEILIKVATESGGVKEPITEAQEVTLLAYLYEIADAGVTIRIINLPASLLDSEIDIYYDTQLIPDDVEQAVLLAAQNYINNLPFNGEYTNAALIDAIQQISGVRVPEMKWSRAMNDQGEAIQDIDARYLPIPGYLNLGDVQLNMLPYVF